MQSYKNLRVSFFFMPKKLFILEQAEKLLPSVKGLLKKAVFLNRKLASLRSESVIDQAEIEFETQDQNVRYQFELVKNHDVLNQLTEDFYDALDKIRQLGCEIKDLDSGLVDFPSKFEGRTVHLCYKLGEDRIRHWHELDSGFAARQKIVDIV